ncbi:MAG: nitrilase, partial [Gemmatimonadetes bacterium]|nr:nitrilase [Gemmatimonadota bacterium]
MTHPSTVRVAVVQAAAKPFDTPSAVDKVCSMTAQAAEQGAELVLFPEAYVGGYPWGLSFGTAVGGR